MRFREHWIYRPLAWLAAAELFVLMLTVALDVAGRYLFNKPLPAGYELVQVQMGLLAFTTLPLLCRDNEHIALGLLDHWFTGRVNRVRLFCIHLISAAGLGFLGWRIWVYASKLGEMNEGTPVLNIPLAPLGHFMAVMAVAGACALAVLAFRAPRAN